MPGKNRLVHLDVCRARPDQSGGLLPQGVREVEGQPLLVAVVLIKRERCEGERPREDRFHGCLRIRPCELPFARVDGLLPCDWPSDHGLTIVCVLVEIPREAVDLDGRESTRDVALAVVPCDLAIRDVVDSTLAL